MGRRARISGSEMNLDREVFLGLERKSTSCESITMIRSPGIIMAYTVAVGRTRTRTQ